ncbi:MAG: hypothetical protein JSS11_00850 [Verrucomicrobia bacterium]|nr:hypothetical protein [Verrucomicrobiota bacterium]
MDTPPPPSEPPPVAPRSRGPILGGFLVGAVIWLLPPAVALLQPKDGYAVLPFLIFASLLLPPVSLILALIPNTRRVGLGLLLACGLGWLILGAMCGGLIR